jgi:lysyl-tRNA synthetase class 1
VSDEQPQNPRAPKAKAQKTGDWVLQAADTVLAFVGERRPIVCASGISPSGPIHLGNLREVMTTHLVAGGAAPNRGHEVIHHHSWDDFDRLRKDPGEHRSQLRRSTSAVPIAEIPDPIRRVRLLGHPVHHRV